MENVTKKVLVFGPNGKPDVCKKMLDYTREHAGDANVYLRANLPINSLSQVEQADAIVILDSDAQTIGSMYEKANDRLRERLQDRFKKEMATIIHVYEPWDDDKEQEDRPYMPQPVDPAVVDPVPIPPAAEQPAVEVNEVKMPSPPKMAPPKPKKAPAKK